MVWVEGGAGGGLDFRVSGSFKEESMDIDPALEVTGSFLGLGGGGLLSGVVSNCDMSWERWDVGDNSRR